MESFSWDLICKDSRPDSGHVVIASQVCFLYKLTPGACPKSYGHNVARLAGLPASVVANASAKARAMEEAVCNRMPNHLGESDSSLEIVAEAIVTAVSAGLPEKVREVWKKLSHGLV